MSVRIVIDSTADIQEQEARALNVEIVPLKVIFGDKEYRDGIDLTNQRFYEMMDEAPALPTTTQPSVGEFEAVFSRGSREDEIVGIFIAGKLSGTAQSATMAKEALGRDNIYIVDSGTTALGAKLLINIAIEMRDKGCSAKEIADKIEEEKGRVVIYAVLNTLKNLQKGGRLSKTAAIAGGLLGVKPIIRVQHGIVDPIGKERGIARAFAFVEASVEGEGVDRGMEVLAGFTYKPEFIEEFFKVMGEKKLPKGTSVSDIGAVIGTHVSRGGTAYAFFKEK